MSDEESRERSAVELLVIRFQLGEREAFDGVALALLVPARRQLRELLDRRDALARELGR